MLNDGTIIKLNRTDEQGRPIYWNPEDKTYLNSDATYAWPDGRPAQFADNGDNILIPRGNEGVGRDIPFGQTPPGPRNSSLLNLTYEEQKQRFLQDAPVGISPNQDMLNKFYPTAHTVAIIWDKEQGAFVVTNGAGGNYSGGNIRLNNFEYEIFEYAGEKDGMNTTSTDAVTGEIKPITNGRFYIHLGNNNNHIKTSWLDISDMSYLNTADNVRETVTYALNQPKYYKPSTGTGQEATGDIFTIPEIDNQVKPWNPLVSWENDIYKRFMDVRGNRNREAFNDGIIDYATNLGSGGAIKGMNIYRGYYSNTEQRNSDIGPARIDRIRNYRPQR